MRIGSSIIAVVLVLTMGLASGVAADDSVVEVRRGTVGDIVLAYSPVLKGLEQDRINLSQDYLDLKKQMDGLELLYDQLGAYKGLYNLYSALSSTYDVWVGLMSLADQSNPADPNLLAANAMIDGDDPDDNSDGNGLNNAQELALAAEVAMMPYESFVAYVTLKTQFELFGITDPNLSKQEEYDTFVYPIEIAPAALQLGAQQLATALEQTAAGVKSGAEGLFDGALQLQGFLELQKLSYEIALETEVETTRKYELGQVSEGTYLKAVNDAKIAELNYKKMVRDVDNLKMNLNVMMGQAVTTELILVQEVGNTVTLESIDFYIARGLVERAEMINNKNNRTNKQNELDIVDEYLQDTSIEYRRGESMLADYALEKAYSEKAIEVDIRKAYSKVLDKAENYRIKSLSLEDALRQQKEMQLNQELGFVTESMAKGLDVLVVQATNDYYSAYREYLAAVDNLELASGIGAADMTALTGGMIP